FSSRRRHTRWPRDWSSDVCSSDLKQICHIAGGEIGEPLIDIGDSGLVKHAEPIAGGLSLVLHDRRQEVFTHGRLMRLADLEGAQIGRASCRERVWRAGVGKGVERQ